MDGNSRYDELLAQNKAAYEAGEITKEVYQKRAKQYRKGRRKAAGSPNRLAKETTTGEPKEKTPKKRRQKEVAKLAPTITPEDVAEVEAQVVAYFEELGLPSEDFISSTKSFLVTTSPSLASAQKAAEGEGIHPAEAMLQKFRARFNREPDFYITYLQGGFKLFGLGPVLSHEAQIQGSAAE